MSEITNSLRKHSQGLRGKNNWWHGCTNVSWKQSVT